MNILDKNWKIVRWHILEAGDVYLLEGVCGIWAVIVEKDDNYLYSCVWLRLEDATCVGGKTPPPPIVVGQLR